MTNQMTLEQVTDKLYDELDNADPGTVLNFELIEEGWYDGLQHNGYWIRVIKFDKNNYIYAAQSDSYDEDPAIGTLEDAAEYVKFQADIVADREQMIEASA